LPHADVVVPVDRHIASIVRCTKLSDVESCNRGLADRAGDAVLVWPSAVVCDDWLGELAAVAHSDDRTACCWPLMSAGDACSVDVPSGEATHDEILEMTVRAACAGLPRWTISPIVTGSCIYLRGDAIDAVGLLDASCASLFEAVDDWLRRARSLGFVAKRANHVFVQRPGLACSHAETVITHEESQAAVDASDPHQVFESERFRHSLDAHLPSHAVRLESTGKLRVAFDIRHVPREQVGTRTYAVKLAQALAELPEIELTLLVRNPAQARGLNGRVVTPEQWRDDVALIHRPAQVMDRQDLGLLFQSSAHVIITYQDLIAYRIPLVFPCEAEFEAYRATSRLTLPAVQRVIAISENVAREVAIEFGIPADEIPVVAHGVETESFSDRRARDRLIRSALRVPGRYFFSLASDFPHKNLRNLLDAYAQLRRRWNTGKPPWLVLAGYASGARTGLYPRMEREPLEEGVILLGPVSQRRLTALYRHALALVFSSLYEGFGLPILEAMAAGTPVIAMPISAVPEVGGDCVLYADGLSSRDLARAMERIASDGALREDLCERGRKRVQEFRWEKTARATLEVYRSTVLRPSERSLRTRRLLRDAIIHWSENRPLGFLSAAAEAAAAEMVPSIGIRSASRALDVAVRARLRRELRRFRPVIGQQSA